MIANPTLPAKIYLRRKEVETAVGGRRQREALEAAGHLKPVRLPGYEHAHYIRGDVQAVLDNLFGAAKQSP